MECCIRFFKVHVFEYKSENLSKVGIWGWAERGRGYNTDIAVVISNIQNSALFRVTVICWSLSQQ